jgi:hypothetical protein
MVTISEQNARSQAVTLPATVFCFEVEGILTPAGFDPFCPERRQKALSKMASNLQRAFNRS